METSFRVEDTPEARRVLSGQLRECYGRAVYSHKTHEKCADILIARSGHLKVLQIVLSSLATCGFAATVFDSTRILGIIGAGVSTILLALNSYTKDYDLGAAGQMHKQAANDIWLIRERYLSLLADLAMGRTPLEELIAERDSLSRELHVVYAGSPSTTYGAYKKAQQSLKVNEDMTFSDDELDAFLPPDLKRGVSR